MKKIGFKNILKIAFHAIVLIAAFVLGFLVVVKGVKFDFLDFLTKEESKSIDVVETEVSNEYLENQLLQDWKDRVLTVDEYFKNLVFAEYDKEYLSNRYYPLKRTDLPLDTDFIASTYATKLTDTTLNYYLNRVLLTGVTFDSTIENPEYNDDDKIVAIGETVYASDISKKVNLNRLYVSGNNNFVIWYTTTGSSAITEEQAREIATELEISRYTYDKMYNRYFKYKPDFINSGSIHDAQLRIYDINNVDRSLLTSAMQVYVVNYLDNAAAKYVVADKLTEIYDKFQYGSIEGSIPGPYMIIRASSYNDSKERTMQVVNRELFRHYQYNVYCPDESCLINDDPYYFDAMASYASEVATKKYTYKGFFNDWVAIAREHSSDLLSEEIINKYGIKNISNALSLYLYYYSQVVPDANRKIIESLYESNPFQKLEQKATDAYLVEIIQKMAMDYIRQDADNANIIASPGIESEIHAKYQIAETANIEREAIEKMGIDYFVLDKGENSSYSIEFSRGSAKVTCLLIGVMGNSYSILAKAPVGTVNVRFNTKNYAPYEKYYIIIANASVLESNVYSLDVVAA